MSENKTVWGTSSDNEFEYITLTDALLDETLELFHKSFCKDETVSICTEISKNLQAANELAELCKITAKDGASIVAIEKSSGKIVAVALNKIQRRLEPNEKAFFDEFAASCKHKSSQALVQFMYDVDSKFDIFEHYKINYLLEIMFLFTDANYRGRKLGQAVCEASMKLAEAQSNGQFQLKDNCNENNIRFEALSALCTSNISRGIFKNLKFDELLIVSFDEFQFNGRKYTEILPAQKNVVLVGKKIC